MLSIHETFLFGSKTKNGSYVEIFKNPSSLEIANAYRNDYSAINYGDVRGFLAIDGTLYIGLCEEEELIHDFLLKMLSREGYLSHKSGWETNSIEDYLAIFILNRTLLQPSGNSYREALSLALIKRYRLNFNKNTQLSYLEFEYSS